MNSTLLSGVSKKKVYFISKLAAIAYVKGKFLHYVKEFN